MGINENSDLENLYKLYAQMLKHAYNGDFNFLEKNARNLIKLRPYFKDEYNIVNDFYDFIIYFTDMYNKTKDNKLKSLGIDAYNAF